ncbi:glycosyltransferase [Shewanella frigidimarina]|uniref:glycosyltransferase n=1 Tax=Shewanella frigidimarina TaxID=56812 RepID=UPI003D79367C
MSNDDKGIVKGLKADHPLVTVYMPTHNRLTLLRRAVQSVLEQSYQHFELIIVNDGSSDETESYLEQLAATDSRVRCFHQSPAQGACVARNVAIKEARGTFITGLDDDDEFLPNRLEMFLDAWDPHYAFLCHGFRWQYGKRFNVVDATAMTVTLPLLLDYNYATNQVFTLSSRLRDVDGFDPTFKACQDYDTWVRLVLRFGSAARLNGASYILHQGHEGPRITVKSIDGLKQFYTKYSDLMSCRNKKNQHFLRLMAQKETLSFMCFMAISTDGRFIKKLRYFLSSHFIFLADVRKRYLKEGKFNGWK